MDPNPGVTYESSLKSDISDEPINIYVIRPIAHQFVRGLYHSRITPNQVTGASIVAGIAAAAVYLLAGPVYIPLAGLLVTLKDILDSADGQLARAKEMYSRFGRFLDSIGDFAVNLFIFAAISLSIFEQTGEGSVFLLGLLGFLGISLRVSYHVFYQTSYLHLLSSYTVNRLTEEVRKEDLDADAWALRLQKLFVVLYGWQDRLMMSLDLQCRRGISDQHIDRWYGDPTALRLSGFQGLGTELFFVMIFSIVSRLDLYLVFNLVGLNALWGCSIAYRRLLLARQLTARN
jgi:phosphatidylglycerophosphate synthase